MFRQKSSTIDWINAERPRAMASSLQYCVIILWCHRAKICNTERTCCLPAAFAIQASETVREVRTQKNSVHVRGLYLKHLSDSEYPEISKYEGPNTKHSVPPLLVAPSSTRKVIILAQSIFLSHTRTRVRSVKVARHLRKEFFLEQVSNSCEQEGRRAKTFLTCSRGAQDPDRAGPQTLRKVFPPAFAMATALTCTTRLPAYSLTHS